MKKKIYREKSYEWKWQIFEKRKKKKKRKNKNRDEIFWTRRKNRDELAETQEGGKDGRWRVIREWRVRGWADRGGITFLLLSIDRSSYRSASSSSSSLFDFFLPPASSSLACFQLFLPSNGGTHSIRRGFSPTISRRHGVSIVRVVRPVIDRKGRMDQRIGRKWKVFARRPQFPGERSNVTVTLFGYTFS